MSHFNIEFSSLDKNTQELMLKGAIVRDLIAGNVNPRIQKDFSVPFNFKKDEVIIYGFQMPVHEVVTKKERVGGYSGASVRVMKGVYWHFGGSKGQTVETQVRENWGNCAVVVTSKNIYILSEQNSMRIPLNKVVTVAQSEHGVIIYRDGQKNNPLEFITNDEWFLHNILLNASNWDTK